ncbi:MULTISPECIES: ABC transporter ATP-binding protein [Cellulophaga]|uniref:Xenobiotic-transporting ATPase n=1 Tax=Cellulophaga lytica (strain ATCC 23178 / DSM 7489 / JCM 8516 / NBRC 14961 / NCIMB 1423 / VKM B-1433 / Cy l20) TaxID=867900 RepID=F0RGE6_CELLC|nr:MULTISPECIES: ABC transporter ATP-binding protein [Cellulophaga]ADY30137.1 Xenobiotic-transporting ATPase [Cellulophaga lytica DSM 7489]TVZ10533.1 ABC-type multidrug transport system fused ATPase/permease subunit [Cellulophaga sp. RHA_52]WQG75701.1 ABC transporter ATP-binding protein [Cellulophaga lytica]SNQ43301.1 ABC-1 type exporter, ATP-binding/permease protein [Cellulophaga lytica]
MSKTQKETGKAFDYTLLKRLLQFTKPYKITFYGVVIAAISLSAFAVLSPILLREIVNTALENKDQELLLNIIVLMLIVLVLEVVSQLSFVYYANWLGESVIKDIRIKLFKHMLSFKMKYYDNSSVGLLVTRAVTDIQRIGEIFSQGFFMIVSDLLKMVVVAGVMVFYSWKLALIVFAIMPIIIYATRVFQKAMKVAFIDVRAQVSNLNTFVQERLTGMKIVQFFNREKVEQEKFRVINEKHRNAWLKTVWYNSIFFPIAEIVSSVAIGLIVWYGGLRVVLNNNIDELGTIFMFIQLSQMLFRPLRQIADKFNVLQMGMVAANRVFAILDRKDTITNEGAFEKEEIKGDISFKNVHFGYVEGEEVLHGISFDVKAGETIAIVGATGAGKSTIINLLNRFYEINSGEILVDGVDIKDYKLTSLRDKIAVVLQDVFLFADTIENNISLKNEDITLDTITQAAQEISVHDFITSLPNDYQYNVKERGSMLSSGQRQLLAFLRAYVSNPSILILDEATSSVDTYSEQLIQKATEKITQGRTSIVIAHRLATIKKADKIIVMDAGNIIESGSHKELLKKGGYYYNLYQAQFVADEVA